MIGRPNPETIPLSPSIAELSAGHANHIAAANSEKALKLTRLSIFLLRINFSA